MPLSRLHLAALARWTLLMALLSFTTTPAPARAEADVCTDPLPLSAVDAQLAEAPARILGFDALAVSDELRQLTRQLPCATTPVPRSTLGRLWFLRGLSRVYAAEEGRPVEVAGENAAITFFRVAHRVDPALVWDRLLLGETGEELWDEALLQQARAEAGAEARVPLAPVADFWVRQALIDGRALGELGPLPALLPGTYLLQYPVNGGWGGAWLKVEAGSGGVALPLPAAPAPVAAAPPPAPPPAPVEVIHPPPQRPAAPPTVRLGLTAATWRLPQLYSGPELLVQVSPGRRLVAGVGVGLAGGALTQCAECLPADGARVVLPVHGEAALRLGRGAVELDVGLQWQSWLGGGFGRTGEPEAKAAHALLGTATVLVGRGSWRGMARFAAGEMLLPGSLRGPSGVLQIGLVKELGGRGDARGGAGQVSGRAP